MIDSRLNKSQQGAQAASKASYSIRHGRISLLGEGTVPIYTTMVWLSLECCVQFWAPHNVKRM